MALLARLILVVAILCTHQTVQADNSVQLVIGRTSPMGDSTYADFANSDWRIAGHGAILWPKGLWQLGPELTISWNPIVNDYVTGTFGRAPDDRADLTSIRALVGARFEYHTNRRLTPFARVAVGLDVVRTTAQPGVLLSECSLHTSGAGFGAYVGGGLMVSISEVKAGVQVGVPVAIHDHELACFRLKYRSYEFETSLVLSVHW